MGNLFLARGTFRGEKGRRIDSVPDQKVLARELYALLNNREGEMVRALELGRYRFR